MALPAATIEGTVRCALCNQAVVVTGLQEMAWAEVQQLVRAHQRSEVCSG